MEDCGGLWERVGERGRVWRSGGLWESVEECSVVEWSGVWKSMESGTWEDCGGERDSVEDCGREWDSVFLSFVDNFSITGRLRPSSQHLMTVIFSMKIL